MTTIERYAEDHPGLWEQAGRDYKVFPTLLALSGLINYADVEWLIWEHEKVHAPAAEAPPTEPTLPPRDELMLGVSNIYELIRDYPAVWDESDGSSLTFVDLLAARGYITAASRDRWVDRVTSLAPGPIRDQHEYPTPPAAPPTVPAAEAPGLIARAKERIFGPVRDAILVGVDQIIKSFYDRMPEKAPSLWTMIWPQRKIVIEPLVKEVSDACEAFGRQLYDEVEQACLKTGPVTPERAPALATKLFGFALGAGMTAHVTSSVVEGLYFTKELGLNQAVGMVAQLAGFGPISAATLGVITYAALRRPMQYAVNAVTRSQLPDDQLLQIMAVKPDIDLAEFRKTMTYHGYSDYWIDRIVATMYHEPRYFELKMMSEDQLATDAWLYTKSRRAGFSEADSKIMVSSYLKTASRTQRIDFYRQAFYLYKEGFIDRGLFDRYLDELEFRPEAKQFAARAADLAYTLDTVNDSIKYWTDCYSKDLIDEDELAAHLSLLGVTPSRAWLIRKRAIIKKTKRPGQPAPTELEKAQSKIQTQYAQAYVTLYRKDLIDEDTLIADLIAIGIVPELAEATAALEAVRKLSPAAAAGASPP